MVVYAKHFTDLAGVDIHIEISQEFVHVASCDPPSSLHI